MVVYRFFGVFPGFSTFLRRKSASLEVEMDV